MTNSNGLAMSWEEWHRHDAVALADLVRARAVDAKELCAQAAAAVARIDPQIEAVLGLYDDVVADPDKDGPTPDGRLYGVPMLLKDLGSGLAGRKQESGSKLFKDHVVEATDPLVDNYLSAGLIPIGRSTTPEFGMTFDTATDYLGRVKVTRNPWHSGANRGRLVGRFGGGRCRRDRAGRHVFRRRRIDPHPGRVLWSRRAQGDPRPGAAAAGAERIHLADQHRRRRHPQRSRHRGRV